MKIAIIEVICCRECPFSDKFTNGEFFCNKLDRKVDKMEIDKDCQLEDLIDE